MRFFVSASLVSVLLCLACGPLSAAKAEEPSTAEKTVNTLNAIFGVHPGYRANHAKGVVVEGHFDPSPEGSKVSKAILFQGKPSPVTVRFSDSGGLPALPDGAGPANPHGMAVKFHLPDGSDMDIVINSLKFFPVANGEEFLALLQAISQSPPGAAKPTKLDAFFAGHPAAPKAFASTSTPSSFARETYNGVDAFIFVDAAGKRQPFRFKVVPVAGDDHLGPEDAAKQSPNFLMDEIAARVMKQPAVFKVMAQLADPGDQTKDPTQAWPDDRKVIELGTLTLDKAVPDSKAAEKPLFYLPSNLPDGIEMSDDPLIDARNQAYAVSFSRRSQ